MHAARLRGALVVLIALVVLHAGGGGIAPVVAREHARVLLIHSYDAAFPTTASIQRGIHSVFGEEGARLDVEYMDSKRLPDAIAVEQFRRLLAFKLARLPDYDLVMVSDDNALHFVLEHHDELLAGLPVVFLTVNDVELAGRLESHPLITGVVEQISIGETLAMMRRLQTDLPEVTVVVDDTISGRADSALLAEWSPRLDGLQLNVLNLGQRSWDELAVELAALEPPGAVLRMAAFADRDGRVLTQDEGLALLVENAPVPVYSLREHDVRAGVLGGVVVDFAEQGRQAALMAERILDGTPVDQVPVLRRSPNRVRFDHEALQRFDLDPGRLPPGAIVLNAPVTLFSQHRETVVTVAVVGAVLLATLLYLAWQIVARRRMEHRLRESEIRFRGMVEGSGYGVLIHRDGVPVFANRSYARLLGYETPAEVLAQGTTQRLYAPSEHRRMAGYQRARRQGRPAPDEYDVVAVRKDGVHLVLHAAVHATTWQGHFATQHNVIDVTEQRQAVELLRDSEARYRTLVENAPEAIVVLDVEAGRLVEANDNACELFAMEREALIGASLASLNPPAQADGRDSATLAQEYIRCALAGEHPVFEWLHRDSRGNDMPTEVRLVRLPAGGRLLVRGSITDIGESLRTHQALTEKSAQLEATLENTAQGICMVDADLRVVAHNARFLELLGFPAERFGRGSLVTDLIRFNVERGEYGVGDVEALVARQLEPWASRLPHRFVRTRTDGRVLEVQGQPVPGGGLVRTYTDITENHRLSQQLAFQARHDELTGLPNRREFEERLQHMLEDARAGGATHAMCYMDLDQFKVINDTCGHGAGDELLRQLGQVLRTIVRRGDTLARLGGDEFGVLLDQCSLDQAQSVAEKLRSAVAEFRFGWEERSFRIGVSIGMVPVNAASGGVSELMSGADAACYAAKDQGRNRIHLYDGSDSELARRYGEMQWVVHIQNALDDGRFVLYCQPIVPLQSADNAHYELLLRMYDEQGELVRPGMFLSSAERYNLIGRLDRWVVSAALDWLAANDVSLMRLCSINLSGQSLADDELLQFITDRFDRSGVAPDRVCFEITETAAISNLARATRFITALKSLGCRFALDDFGSGLSSFGYLKTLPVDFLKIDGLFVKDIVHDAIDHAMVRSINEIGHLMGKRTIAEFVEDAATLDILRSLGVDYAQGYGVGRPMPLAELACGKLLRLASG